MAKPDACYIGMTVIIALVFIVLGSILIGTAPSKTFLNPSDPQFIVGYVFFMILIIFIVNVFVVYNAYYDTKLYYILLFANIIVICTILGATLVGISRICSIKSYVFGGILIFDYDGHCCLQHYHNCDLKCLLKLKLFILF